MKRKLVVVGIDDICRLFADYASLTGFPEDAKAHQLKLNPADRRMMLIVESPSLKDGGVEEIKFQLKRTYIC